MLEKLTIEELDFIECFYTPECMAECLFSNPDNLSIFEEDKHISLWSCQTPLISHEYTLDEDPNLNEKENFVLREIAGNLNCYSARDFGKTLMEKIDIILSLLCIDNEPMAIGSYDAVHIRKVLNPIIDALDFHPIISLFRKHINKSPSFLITTKNGNILNGINMNVTDGNNAGKNFFGEHYKKIWIEEASKETMRVYNIRTESRHPLGCVERASGMTDFTTHSPCGQIYFDFSQQSRVLNLPSFVNPLWTQRDYDKAIKKYGGEQALSFRLYVLGIVIQGSESAIDMERVRKLCYHYKSNGELDTRKTIKSIEIDKEHYSRFKEKLIVERPRNCETLWLASDIGRTGQTEIMLFSEVNRIYHYLYNITLYNLTDEEQFEVFKYLGQLVEANFIGLDCGEGTGVSIFGRLEKVFPRENLVWYAGHDKIPVDFEKTEDGKPVYKKGKLVYRELFQSEWSVQHFCNLMYSERIKFLTDYKLDKQMDKVVSAKLSNRVTYHCLNEDDHLWDACKVFGIMEWKNRNSIVKPIQKVERDWVGC